MIVRVGILLKKVAHTTGSLHVLIVTAYIVCVIFWYFVQPRAKLEFTDRRRQVRQHGHFIFAEEVYYSD
jgi:hypothetical protein